MKRLLVIDGNAMMHRAYHALPPLTTPDGKPIQAVYGFTSMLFRLVTDFDPTYVAIAFDRPAPTFRKKLLPTYQSKRPKMEDDLSSQMVLIHDVVKVFGIPIYEMDGFEADDVIGTIVSKAVGKGDIEQIIVVTGDRDILQLVTDNVFIYMPTKGLSEGKLFDSEATKVRMGVSPSKIVELKALTGDQSDNYDGVPGIGPKTAIRLIDTYGTVEDIYAHISDADIAYGVREKLMQGKESAYLSKDLATIRKDVPIAISFVATPSFNTNEIREMMVRYNFTSLLKRLPKGQEPITTPKEPKKEKTNDRQQELF